MIYCKICGRECADYRGLAGHLKLHKITAKEYYDKFLRKDGEGICPACGRETSFTGMNTGYRKFCSKKCANSGEYSPMFGRCCSREVKDKISKSEKGKIISEASRKKMSKSHQGKTFTEETRRKMSEAKKGKNNPFYGKHHSEETKKKISESLTGEKHPFYGKHRSEETKQKISKANKGKLAGKNHPNYKDGVSMRQFEESYGLSKSEWKELAQKIRKRDKFICQLCGKKGATDVHHIIPRRISIDNSPENLITLCRSCHRKIEYLTDKYLAEGKDPREIFIKNGVNNGSSIKEK